MDISTGDVHLTPAEREILHLIHAGAAGTQREMAARLFISKRTVEERLGSLYRKFEVRCLAHLILKTTAYASQHDDEVNLRVGDYRIINGKRFRVSAYGADSRGWPCIIFESGSESLTIPLTISIPPDALPGAA